MSSGDQWGNFTINDNDIDDDNDDEDFSDCGQNIKIFNTVNMWATFGKINFTINMEKILLKC